MSPRAAVEMSVDEVEDARRKAEARALEHRRRLARTDDVLTYQTRFDSRLSRREDLRELAQMWEAVEEAIHGKRKPIIALVSAPPQVGKTLLGQHACARIICRSPGTSLLFVTYAATLAEVKSREVRDMVRAAGVELRDDSKAVDLWQTRAGGSFIARGIDGGITGMSGVSCAYICDPYKNRAEAESAVIREHIASQVRSAVLTRRAPHTSIVIEHTRWTTNDLIAEMGEAIRKAGLTSALDLVEVNLPAVDLVTGEPRITFGGRDRAFYDAQRVLVAEHDWWALYMGMPRAREGKLFKGLFTYDAPPRRMAVCIALDLAYTASQAADASCLMAVGRDLEAPRDQPPTLYVLDIERGHWAITETAQRIRDFQRRHGGAPMFARTGGQEAAIYEQLATHDRIHVTVTPTVGDKLTNATPASAAWNTGRVLVPADDRPWTTPFAGRVLDFSGLRKGEKDDEIDCLATAHHELTVGAFGMAFATGEVAKGAGRLPAARGGWL